MRSRIFTSPKWKMDAASPASTLGSVLNSVMNLRELCKGATVTEGKRLGITSKDDVKAWLDSLNL